MKKPRHLWGEVRSDVPHIFQVSIFWRPAGFGTCLDLAIAMVAGASMGQSLHPSRCGAYVRATIQEPPVGGNQCTLQSMYFPPHD